MHTQNRWLFTGDHIINGSTVVIDPPDGCMVDYLNSLRKLKTRTIDIIAPGHGAIIDKVDEAIDWIIEHRLERESKVVERLQAHPNMTLAALVTYVYDDVDAKLHPIAERSLLAHLLKLELEGRAVQSDDCWSTPSQ